MSADVSTEIAEIQEVMRDNRAAYFADEGLQQRYRDLLDAQQGGPAPAPKAANEIESIKNILRTEPHRYWRDEGMQARFRDLLAGEERATSPQEADGRDGGLIPILSASDWSAGGGDAAGYSQHVALVREVNDLLVATGEAERGAVSANFERLPASVHRAAFRELLSRTPAASEPFTEAEMAEIKTVPAWAELAREWQGEAPARLGRIRARLWRVLDATPEADMRAAIAWINAAPKGTLMALGRKLGR